MGLPAVVVSGWAGVAGGVPDGAQTGRSDRDPRHESQIGCEPEGRRDVSDRSYGYLCVGQGPDPVSCSVRGQGFLQKLNEVDTMLDAIGVADESRIRSQFWHSEDSSQPRELPIVATADGNNAVAATHCFIWCDRRVAITHP